MLGGGSGIGRLAGAADVPSVAYASPNNGLVVSQHVARAHESCPSSAVSLFQPTALYGDHFAGPFRVPASGEVGIAVYQPDGFFRFCYDSTCGGVYQFVGAYSFRVVPINRAPESVPAAYTVGDTVRGEAIYPAGDIDEFTTTAVPGDTLTAYIRLTAAPVGVPDQFHGLTLEVIDPATGNTLAGSLEQFFGQTFNPVGSFAVPAGGALLIRVRGTGTFGDELTTAPYEFFVKRGQ